MKEDNPLSQPEKGFTRRALNKGGYDPRSVLRWGQMMAISLLEVVKAVQDSLYDVSLNSTVSRRVNVLMRAPKDVEGTLSVADNFRDIW